MLQGKEFVVSGETWVTELVNFGGFKKKVVKKEVTSSVRLRYDLANGGLIPESQQVSVLEASEPSGGLIVVTPSLAGIGGLD